MSVADVRMTDVSNKAVTLREAVAQARISLSPETVTLIRNKEILKGDVVTIAKCAGISAAKKTAELIPLCHPLSLEHIEIVFELEKSGILIRARCKTQAKTGVEMEAMTACCICALTIYDMCKYIEKGAVIGQIQLLEKKGGKSGRYKSE